MKPQLTERSDGKLLAECDPTPSPTHPAPSLLGVGSDSRSKLRSPLFRNLRAHWR